MIRFIVFTLLILLFLVGAVLLEGGRLLVYVGISAFIVVFFPPVFACLAVWRWEAIGGAFRDSLGRRGASRNTARSARVWGFFERVSLLSGVLGWLLGLVIILNYLAAPWPAAVPLSVALSSSLLPLVYGILLGILARILRARVEGRPA